MPAPQDFQDFQTRLLQNPAVRIRFMNDLLGILERNGVNVDNPELLRQLSLDNQDAFQRRVQDWVASSTIVTIIG